MLPMATVPVAMRIEGARGTPPYLPFSRFLQSLDALSGCMPTRIDRTLWSSESPYLATVLVNAYTFLGLTNEDAAPTALLQRLVGDTKSRPATLREVLDNAYGDVLRTISTATTTAEVEQSLSLFRVSGATNRKAVSFLLQACRYAGIHVSKLVTARSRLSHAKASSSTPDTPIETTMTKVTLRSGGEITLSGRFDPFALSAEDRGFVFKLVDELAAYKVRRLEHEKAVPADHEEVPF